MANDFERSANAPGAGSLSRRRAQRNRRSLAHARDLARADSARSYFVWLVLDLLHMDYNGVRDELGRPVPAILLLAFIMSRDRAHGVRDALDHRRLPSRPQSRVGAGRQHLLLRAAGARLRLRHAAHQLHLRQPRDGTFDGHERLPGPRRAGARRQGLSDHRPHLRRRRRRSGRLGLARERRLRPGRPQDGVRLQSVPDPLAHGRGAGRHLRLARQHGPGRLALAHVRHRQGLGLAGRSGRDRVPLPQRAGRGLRARSLGRAVLAHRRPARSISVRSAA